MQYISSIPYVPSTEEKVNLMLELAEVKAGMKTADLGSGDGRVVIAFAQAGALAHGFEISHERVKLAVKNIQEAGLKNKAFIHHRDFWTASLANFDVITLYGITSIMGRLEKKLEKELKIGAKVISNVFTFPHWKAELSIQGVYVYRVPQLAGTILQE